MWLFSFILELYIWLQSWAPPLRSWFFLRVQEQKVPSVRQGQVTVQRLSLLSPKVGIDWTHESWTELLRSSSSSHLFIQPTDTDILDILLTWFALKHYEIPNSGARWF